MSLDVYLEGDPQEVDCECPNCFNEHKRIKREEFFTANVTHNLTEMADAAGLYLPLWHPERLNITKARDLIEPVSVGLNLLELHPERFKKFNPENGWGSYDRFVPWIGRYLEALRDYPDANVRTST